MKPLILAAAVSLLPLSTGAQENYASAWSHHRTVFLNTTANGAGVLNAVTNFPVLVRLGSADSAIFAQSRSGGADLRFTKADNVTRLKHQIDSWDSAGNSAAIWVLADTVKGNTSAQSFRMHWGNATAADSSNGTAVFSNGFTNVWHLGNAAGANARPNAIGNGNPATPTNFPGGYAAVAGIIGKADHFRGGPGYSSGNPTASIQNDYMNLGSLTIDYSAGFTFSAWINPEIIGNNTIYYSASEAPNGTATSGLIVVGIQGNESSAGAKLRQRNSGSGSNSGILNTDGQMLSTLGVWSHVLFTQNATGDMTIFLNGVDVGEASGITQYTSVTRPVNQLGTSLAHMQYTDTSFHGTMDEARLANVGRPPDWAMLEYENQKVAQTLVFFDSVPVALVRGLRFARSSDLSVQSAGGGFLFSLRTPAAARVTVLDMRGRTVWTGVFAPGANRLEWDGRTSGGSAAPSGLYSVQLRWMDGAGTVEEKVPLFR